MQDIRCHDVSCRRTIRGKDIVLEIPFIECRNPLEYGPDLNFGNAT